MDIKRKIIINTIVYSAMMFWQMLLNFFLLPFIVRHVGAEEYGIYLLVLTFNSYFALLDLGVSVSVVKYVAGYYARREYRRLNEVINSSFFFYLGIGVFIALCLTIVATFFHHIFNISPDLVPKTRHLLYIVAFFSIFAWPLGVANAVLVGLQRRDVIAVITFFVSIVNAAGTVALLSLGYDIVVLILFTNLISTVGWALNLYWSKRLMPFVAINLSFFNLDTLRMIFKFSLALFIMSICSMLLYQQTDRVIIGIFLPVANVTFYEVAIKPFHLTRMIHGWAISAIMPAASELEAKRDFIALQGLVHKGSKYLLAIILPITISFIILAKPFLSYWMGSDYEYLTLVAQVAVSQFLFAAILGVLSQVLIGIGKIKPVVIYTVAVTVINVFVSVILVQRYGVLGVVLGALFPSLLFFPFYATAYFRVAKVRWGAFLRQAVLPTYPLAAFVALLLYMAYRLRYPQRLLEVAIYGMLTFATYLALFYATGVSSSERSVFGEQILQFLPKTVRAHVMRAGANPGTQHASGGERQT